MVWMPQTEADAPVRAAGDVAEGPEAVLVGDAGVGSLRQPLVHHRLTSSAPADLTCISADFHFGSGDGSADVVVNEAANGGAWGEGEGVVFGHGIAAELAGVEVGKHGDAAFGAGPEAKDADLSGELEGDGALGVGGVVGIGRELGVRPDATVDVCTGDGRA